MRLSPQEKSLDLYKILEISPASSRSEIRRAYHRMVIKHHPDLHQSSQAEAEERIKLINIAATILLDPGARAAYDRARAAQAAAVSRGLGTEPPRRSPPAPPPRSPPPPPPRPPSAPPPRPPPEPPPARNTAGAPSTAWGFQGFQAPSSFDHEWETQWSATVNNQFSDIASTGIAVGLGILIAVLFAAFSDGSAGPRHRGSTYRPYTWKHQYTLPKFEYPPIYVPPLPSISLPKYDDISSSQAEAERLERELRELDRLEHIIRAKKEKRWSWSPDLGWPKTKVELPYMPSELMQAIKPKELFIKPRPKVPQIVDEEDPPF